MTGKNSRLDFWREVADDARLRFPQGAAAKHYNALQKLSYVAMVAILLPAMVLTGLTMSPGLDAAVPQLLSSGGRQSALTIHFIAATLVVVFVVVHLTMALLLGVWNNLRSMITGRYAIQESEPKP